MAYKTCKDYFNPFLLELFKKKTYFSPILAFLGRCGQICEICPGLNAYTKFAKTEKNSQYCEEPRMKSPERRNKNLRIFVILVISAIIVKFVVREPRIRR